MKESARSKKEGFIVQPNPTCGLRLDAALVAEPFRNEIRQRVQTLKEHGVGSSFVEDIFVHLCI
jgi:hypothetical protein